MITEQLQEQMNKGYLARRQLETAISESEIQQLQQNISEGYIARIQLFWIQRR